MRNALSLGRSAGKHTLFLRHVEEQRRYHTRARKIRQAHSNDLEKLHRDVAVFARDPGARRLKELREKTQGGKSNDKERDPDLS